jgi:cobalamin-dependent methionine synthase I
MPQYFSYIVAVSFIGQGTQVSSTNKTDCHDITEILLKVVLSTINHNHFDVIVVTKMLF